MNTPRTIPAPTSFDTDSALATVWAALECFREDSIPEGDSAYDDQWGDICTAMAWIGEALTPTGRAFDAFEIQRVGEWKDTETRAGWCEPIAWDDETGRDEPDSIFWTVYGHRMGEGAEAIGDFKTYGHAAQIAQAISAGRPVHLMHSLTPGFTVTYEIVTPESAEHGDAESRGYVDSHGYPLEPSAGYRPGMVNLSRAVEMATRTRTAKVDGVAAIEPDSSDHGAARSVRIINGMEYETGATETRTIHFPPRMTPARRRQLVALLCS